MPPVALTGGSPKSVAPSNRPAEPPVSVVRRRSLLGDHQVVEVEPSGVEGVGARRLGHDPLRRAPRGVVKHAAKPDTNPLEYRSTPLLAAGHLIEPIRLVLARRGV